MEINRCATVNLKVVAVDQRLRHIDIHLLFAAASPDAPAPRRDSDGALQSGAILALERIVSMNWAVKSFFVTSQPICGHTTILPTLPASQSRPALTVCSLSEVFYRCWTVDARPWWSVRIGPTSGGRITPWFLEQMSNVYST